MCVVVVVVVVQEWPRCKAVVTTAETEVRGFIDIKWPFSRETDGDVAIGGMV